MSRKITIFKKSSKNEGSCSACTNYTIIDGKDIEHKEHDVYVITLRSVSVRLCEECKDIFLKGIKEEPFVCEEK